MAKQNTVFMIGKITSNINISQRETSTKCTFNIQTLRRNGKYDEPMVVVYDKNLIRKIQANVKTNDFVLIKGLLTTLNVIKSSVCNCCGHQNRGEGMLSAIVPIDLINLGPNHHITEFQEFSNNIIAIGTVSNTPKSRELPTGTSITSYQLALNRKYHIKEQEEDQKSDYPWVSTFGEQAQEDMIRLKQGSQIAIDGGLQTRVVRRNLVCENCKQNMISSDIVSEIVPYSVEYLNNCIFEEHEDKNENEK